MLLLWTVTVAGLRLKARCAPWPSAGAETLKTIVRAADKLGVKVISAYAFSTENWKRPVTEVNFIMELLSRYLTNEIDEFNENNVQVRFIGSRKGLPEIVQQKMDTQ